MGPDDLGLQWWEVLQPGISKMISAGYNPGFEEKPMLLSLWMIFEDNSIFKKEDFTEEEAAFFVATRVEPVKDVIEDCVAQEFRLLNLE